MSTQVIKSSFIYLGTSIINKALPFLLLPVLTKYLTPFEYGVLAIFQVFASFFDAFIIMSLHTNISKNFFKFSKDRLAKFISNIIVVLAINFIFWLMILGIIIFKGQLFWGIPQRWILALPIISVMNALNLFNLTILRNAEKPLLYGFFEIFKTSVNFIITIVLVVIYKMGWEGGAFGIFYSSTLLGLIGIGYIVKSRFLIAEINRESIKEILHISVPLLPHALGAIIITLSDRLFIDRMIDKEAVALYSVGYIFGMIVLLVVDAFTKAWSPWFYKIMQGETEEAKLQVTKLTYLFSVTLLFLGCFVTVVSHWIFPFMTSELYYGANRYIAWVAFGYVFYGFYTLFFPYIVHKAKTHFLGILTSLAAVFNLIANYILIKLNGSIGAAQATFLTYFVIFISIFVYANKIMPMPWLAVFRKKV